MSDYSTSTAPGKTRYQEDTPTITPEIVEDDEVVDAEAVELDYDVVLLDTNPVAVFAGNFQSEVSHPLAPIETNYTEQEARQATEDLKVKILHAAEAQYELIHAAQTVFDGHIWIALGYPEGMKGWTRYCADYLTSDQIRITGQQRTDLIMGFDLSKISNRGIAALLGVSEWTVRNAKTKAGIAAPTGRVRDAAGKRQHVDKGGMSSEERQKRIVELSGQGMKQNDIAELMDVSQSTVSDTLRKDKIRRWSEGLDAPDLDDDYDADDDRPLAIDMGDADDKARSYIEAFDAMARDADGALESLVEKLESDHWRPGGAVVDEIIARDADTIFSIMDLMGKFLRLLNIDAETVFGDMEDEHGKWARFIDGTAELGTVCAEVCD